jgi:pyrimidine-specific ribonucleoside hydrolase
VLQSGAPLTFVPLDATNQAPVTPAFYERLGKDKSTPAAEFVYRLLTRQIDRIQSGLYWFWDPLTAAISTDAGLGTFAERSVSVVEAEGPQSGATRVSDGGSPARVTTAVDRARFEALFLAILNGREP